MISFPLFCYGIEGCRKCFHDYQTNHKFTDTPILKKTKYCFIGEAPSFNRKISGLTFGAKSRDVFKEILSQLELSVNEVYTTNIIKCTLPELKIQGKADLCHEWLQREITIVNPKVIFTMGREASRAVIGEKFNFFHYYLPEFPDNKKRLGIPLPHPMTCVYNPKNLLPYLARLEEVKREVRHFLSEI